MIFSFRSSFAVRLPLALASFAAVLTLGGCAQPDVGAGTPNSHHAAPRMPEDAARPALQHDRSVGQGSAIVPPLSAEELPFQAQSRDDASPVMPACSCSKRFEQTGIASWYGKMFNGRRTASGERYDMHAMTAAHRTLPLGACVRVTALGLARSVVVRINDRGPFVRGRIIDLSYAAAEALGARAAGNLSVKLEHIAPARDTSGARRCLDRSA
jgi:rare lipoprotein A